MMLGQKVFIKQKCSHINCYISYDENLLKEDHRNFDAVVFKGRNIINYVASEINITRSPEQLYIFNSLDSSEVYPVCNKMFDNFFNWTWTYKLNSDVVHPFFNIYDINNKIVGPKIELNWTRKMDHTDKFKSKMRNKTRAVAWIITKCRLKVKHEEFIKELKKELQFYNYTLDVFGPCGDKKCPKRSKKGCHSLIEKEYFFQMVIEETFAEDYVTERLVRAMNQIAIPIVMGGSNFNRFLPPGSYINAQSFDMKKLGAIIDYLIKKPSTYEYFFDWKNHYYYMARQRSNMCELCTKLNERTNMTAPKTYPKFRTCTVSNIIY
ncbi:alpha-(1,3)-fucosyltransferase C-like [Zerene cesonia]|uniref:alpha-(1,3)-fucosyltransferase C-like n=1 Tax=Zerene cesonia TaxID=33412 RepID=UPI0018E57AE7|nr:alpha-(1,3)-fucosyltransferase C-like [Zerene cesonia]